MEENIPKGNSLPPGVISMSKLDICLESLKMRFRVKERIMRIYALYSHLNMTSMYCSLHRVQILFLKNEGKRPASLLIP